MQVVFIGFLLLCSCGNQNKNGIGDVYIPPVLTFAGDTIPIHDPEIRERLEREIWINQYWQSSTAMWIKKSGRWMPMLDSILRKNQVPEDFKYLVAIESGFENVTSNKGAVGFWQIMEPTGREFGLRIDNEVDERLNPEKSAEAACRLILRGKNVLGKWPETAISYNIGITGLKSVMAGQYSDSFYDLLINPESGRYLFRILAAKLILSQPEKYGFTNLKPYDSYLFKNLVVDQSIPDLPYWCRKNGYSFKCFRALNPWLKTNHIEISDSLGPITFKIPTNCVVYTKLGLPEFPQTDSIVHINNHVYTNLVNQKNIIALKEGASPKVKTNEFHEIHSGESLGIIAQKYNISLSELFNLNPGLEKNQHKILKGQKLRIGPGSAN